MKVDVIVRGLALGREAQRYVAHRVQAALASMAHRVRRVEVHLSDENGPRGGADKRCLVQVGLDGGTGVVVAETRRDWQVAIDCALERAGRALQRRIERKRPRRAVSPRALAGPLPEEGLC